jgi:nucleoid-associated protein YejK
MPPPLTPEQQERRDQERRYVGLFADLEAYEKLAQRLDAAGDTVNAASWRADFARKSGLTPEEAEIVKKIGVQYRKDQVDLGESCRADQLTARHTYGQDRDARRKFLEGSTCQQLYNLIPKAMADLLTALGSRSFTRLDGYTRHMNDNAKILYRQGQPANGQSQIPAATTETTEKPQ